MVNRAKSVIRNILHKLTRFLLPAYKFSDQYVQSIFGGDQTQKSQGYHYYIGYYDIDPLNEISQKILCHRVSKEFTAQTMPEIGDIGLLSISTREFEKLETSRALNWQLGSRVQWLDHHHIIYNDVQAGIQVSRKLNINTKEVVQDYRRAFWSISPDKKLGASLNFRRIRMKRPGYGYIGQSKDGDTERLTLFNLDSGLDEYSVDLSNILLEINFDSGSGDPYLNHIAWSPCSSKLLSLFHFSDVRSNSKMVYPIVFDMTQEKWSIIDDTGFFSHHTWLDSSNILAYKHHKGEWRFCTWNIDSGWSVISKSMPITDGHPSPVRNSDRIIVDTYPNRLGIIKLYLGSIHSREEYDTIGYILNPPGYSGPLRCDLHPRVCKDNSKVICDFPTDEGRRILLIESAYGKYL